MQALLNSSCVRVAQEHRALQILEINHPNFSAQVSLYGGHVLSWQPENHQEVFWVSDSASFQEGKAIRGGIPLCWPWFGGYKDGGNHGFARTSMWQLSKVIESELGVTLVLVLEGENQSVYWPAKFRVEQTLFFGEHFEQSLVINNLSPKDIKYTGALHSYFNVSNPENVSLPNLNNIRFSDKLTGTDNSLAEVSAVGEVDSIFHTNNQQLMIDRGLNRRIEVSGQNHHQYVLWNAGDAAEHMVDVHVGGQHEYVCLEVANTDWQTIPANSSVTLAQTIKVSDL